MKKIRIFILDQTIVGGAERVVSNMATYLAQHTDKKIEIVSVFKKNEKISYPVHDNVQITFLRKDSYRLFPISQRIISNLKIIKSLWKLPIQKNDILISNMTNISNYLTIFKFKHHAKLLAFEHGYHAAYGKFSQWVRRQLFPFVDLVVTLTESEKKVYEQFCKNVVCIPNALSFYPNQQANMNAKRIIAVGRLVDEKGFDKLIPLYKKLALKYSDWDFVLFGTGYLQSKIEKMVADCPTNVKLFPPTVNIEKEMLNSSIYVCTSKTEAFPMVLLEAMACGLPIVSFDCPPGPREILQNGIDGDLVPLNDSELMLQKIEGLINNSNKRLLYSNNGRENVRKFLPEIIYKKWKDILCTIN